MSAGASTYPSVKKSSFRPLRVAVAGTLALAVLPGLIACTGELGGTAFRGKDRDDEQLKDLRDGGDVPAPSAAITELRRLRKVEFREALRELFPELPTALDPARDLPEDNHVEMAFAVPGTVSELEVNRFADAASESLAELGSDSLSAKEECLVQDIACARQLIESFAKRVFRRPPSEQELLDLEVLFVELWQNDRGDFEFIEALDVVVEALLQSPQFLYRWEQGPVGPQLDGELVRFGSYEMASRLSFFLWNAPPDEALMSAADAGRLVLREEVLAQTRRMMLDERFDRALGDFITQWLEVTDLPKIVKDPDVFPDFSLELAQAMFDEARQFTVAVFRSQEPTLTELLTSTNTRVSPILAEYYGVSVNDHGEADLSGTARVGILSQGAMLSAKGNSYRTSPVRRGKFILNRLLCRNVPPPPPDAVVDLPPADPNLTLREQLAEHASAPACRNCHRVMDPLGLAFEHFDGAGAYREVEGSLEIDASGEVSISGTEVSFEDSTELLSWLVQDESVQDCFATQWTRYALGRFEQAEEAGALALILEEHKGAGLRLPALIEAIVTSKPFTHRALSAGEVPQP